MKRIVILVLSAIICQAFSQKAATQTRIENLWISGGAGLNSMGLGAAVGLSCQYGGHTVSVRYSNASEFRFFDLYSPTPSNDVHDFALLYCIAEHRDKWSLSMMSIGLGLVEGQRRGRALNPARDFLSYHPYHEAYETVAFSTVGIAFDAQSCFTPLSVLGLGLDLLGNVNCRSSYVSIHVSFQLGKVN